MSVVLLAAAGLLIKSVARLREVDPGFSSGNLLTMDLALPSIRYPEPAVQARFYDQLDEKIEALPGVESAGFVSVLPLGKNFDGRGLAIEDHPRPPGQEISADMYVVTPGYLHAMGIRLVKGRMLIHEDTENAQLAALINERMARELWPDQDSIGKRIRFPGRPGDPVRWRSIVGVVGDVKQSGLDREANMQFYLPEDQYPFQSGSLVVHTKKEPTGLTTAVREAVQALDPDLPVYNLATMDQLVSGSMSLRRFSMILLGVFAFAALVLAAIGIYSVISYTTSHRIHEIGIRMALGAGRRDVLKIVIGQGMLPAAIGAGIGLVAALLLTRLMTSLLFGVSPADPVTLAIIISMLATVALMACYLPAHRATRTDPMIALRYE
jgi:putative ABC transport system permease protein